MDISSTRLSSKRNYIFHGNRTHQGGSQASEAISLYLEPQVYEDDHLEVVNAVTEDDVDRIKAGRDALQTFEDRSEHVTSVTPRQTRRWRSPTEEPINFAEEVDADQLVTALRRHSRTKHIIFGSVLHNLLQRTTLLITLVPLTEYQPPAE